MSWENKSINNKGKKIAIKLSSYTKFKATKKLYGTSAGIINTNKKKKILFLFFNSEI